MRAAKAFNLVALGSLRHWAVTDSEILELWWQNGVGLSPWEQNVLANYESKEKNFKQWRFPWNYCWYQLIFFMFILCLFIICSGLLVRFCLFFQWPFFNSMEMSRKDIFDPFPQGDYFFSLRELKRCINKALKLSYILNNKLCFKCRVLNNLKISVRYCQDLLSF